MKEKNELNNLNFFTSHYEVTIWSNFAFDFENLKSEFCVVS